MIEKHLCDFVFSNEFHKNNTYGLGFYIKFVETKNPNQIENQQKRRQWNENISHTEIINENLSNAKIKQ